MVGRKLPRWVTVILAFVALGTIAAGMAGAVDPESTRKTSPRALEPFDALVGGAWHLDGSYQVFEWGVGRELLRARSYVVADTDTTLVAEGIWFWHPREESVRGYLAAVRMPVSFFEYITRIEGSRFSHQLTTYGEMGGAFTEEWELTDADHYRWTLFEGPVADGSPMMSGTFERVAWPAE